MLREGDAQQRGLGRGTAKGKDKLQTVTETLRVGSTGGETDSQESSSPPQLKSINSSVLSFLYSPTLTTILDY